MKQLVKKEEATQIIAAYLPVFKESYDVALFSYLCPVKYIIT